MMIRSCLRAGGLAIGFSLFLLAGCAQPGGLTNTSSGPATARSTLQTLPDLKLTLPASLTKKTDAPAAKTLARTLGDTTELTSVPALKSQAWFDLQSSNGFQSFVNQAFKYLRQYAQDHDVQVDQPFQPVITGADLTAMFGMPASMTDSIQTTVKLLVSGSEATKFSIYAQIDATLTNPDKTTNQCLVQARVDVGTVPGGKLVDFLMNVTMTMGGNTTTLPFYGRYNTATGACDMVQNMEMTTSDPIPVKHRMESIQRTQVAASGALTSVNLSRQDGTLSHVQVAYGDDTAGGIASLSESTWNGLPSHYLWGEYYDGSGNLLKRVNGDTHLWVPTNTGSMVNLKDLGFATPPENPKERYYFDSAEGRNYEQVAQADGTWRSFYRYSYTDGIWTSEGSVDGVYWSASSNGTPAIVWRQSSDPAVWTPGDSVYYWKSSDPSSQEGGFWYSNQTLYAGYVVPATVRRFDYDFFTTDEYPLDTLLPLQGSFASTYKVIQQEGDTWSWDWTDSTGAARKDTWTSYSFYLNKTQAAETPVRFNQADGDISLDDKLSSYNMYYWRNGVESKVKGYFLRTTGPVPEYFHQPDSSLVNRVDTGLNQALNDAYTLDVSAYSEQLKEAAGDLTGGRFSQ